MTLIEMETLDHETTDEQRAKFSEVSKDDLIDLYQVLGQVSARDDGPFQDLTEVLAHHGITIPREGPSVHVVRRAIKLIGKLDQRPRTEEMDAFYERGGSLPGE